jgi:hypothetical protein
MDFSIKIVSSKIDVRCDILDPPFSVDNISVPYTRALDLTRASVNLAAFSTGLGVTVVLDAMVLPNGDKKDISMSNTALAQLCTAFAVDPVPSVNNQFNEAYRLMITEPAAFMALDDLIAAITVPHQIPTNCGRALDGLRKILAPGQSVTQSWSTLRDTLRLSRDYVQFVSDTSTGPRHGDRTHIPQPVVQDILERSWNVMNRFIEFRKRGSQPLPESEFPIL